MGSLRRRGGLGLAADLASGSSASARLLPQAAGRRPQGPCALGAWETPGLAHNSAAPARDRKRAPFGSVQLLLLCSAIQRES